MPSEDIKYLTASHINEAQGTSWDIRNILNVLFRHKKKIILFFVVVFVIGTLFTLCTTVDIYKSEAKLMIKLGRETLSMDPMDFASRSGGGRVQDALQSELTIIKSRFVIEQTIDKIGQETFLSLGRKKDSDVDSVSRIRERLIILVGENLSVSTKKSNNIVTLGFQSPSAAFSRDVLDTLIGFYIDRHIQIHQAQKSTDFLQEQSGKLITVVAQKEDQLRRFCEKHGITSVGNQKQDLLEQISSLENDILVADSDISYSQSVIGWLEEKLKKRQSTIEHSPVARINNPVIDSIRTRILDLRFQEADLITRYPDDSRVLITLRAQIKFAESELKKELESLGSSSEVAMEIDPNYQAMELEFETEKTKLHAQTARKQFLAEEVEKRKEELAAFTSNETMLSKLQHEVDIAREEYLHYKDNLQRANIYTALDSHKFSNVSIVQPPTTPVFPLKSDKKRNIGLCFLLGLAGGIGLAFFWESRDDTLKTNEDVEKRLGLPVLTSVPVKNV